MAPAVRAAAAGAALLRWYRGAARDLPWRRTRDPYAILVAEVMLQQTQVARVLPRWAAFLERFPTAEALAAASPADVLREWAGLGYNRRALALRAAAGVAARDGWPRTPDALRALPGVGPYTAAAVASAAFREPVPAVDTNVRRVVERFDRRRRTPAALAARAARLQRAASGGDPEAAAAWNQAMMELGATVCRPRRPDCAACPLPGCRTRGRAPLAVRGRPAPPRVPFEATDRWVRGRVVAALAAGDGLPDGIDAGRLERAVDGLARDGLVVRGPDGVALPDA